MTAGRVAGLFGKLPTHGDFVRRGPAALATRFDDWLSTELGALAAAGADLDTLIADMPDWHFAIRDGDGQWAGVLRGSADRVGRHFPLIGYVAVLPGDDAAVVASRVAAAAASGSADSIAAHLAGIGRDCGARAVAATSDRWWRGGSDRSPVMMRALPSGARFAAFLGAERAAA